MKERIDEKIERHLNSNTERVDEGVGKFFEKIGDMLKMKALAPILKHVNDKDVLMKAVESWKDPKTVDAKISDMEGYKEAMEKAEEGVKKGQFKNLYELMKFMMDEYYKK